MLGQDGRSPRDAIFIIIVIIGSMFTFTRLGGCGRLAQDGAQ
jgi:hypothetical protein